MSGSQSSPYSQDKALWHLDRIAQLREGKQTVPIHWQCSPSGWCQQGCAWCSYRWDGNVSNQLFHVIDDRTGQKNHNPKRFIPREKMLEVIDDWAEMGVKAAEITGGGEPLAHPDIHEILSFILSNGIQLSLVSNGVLLKPEIIATLMQATWVRISVDCSKPGTYATMRRVPEGQFHRAVENISALCKLRDEVGSQVVIGVGFVVSKENWHEVVDSAALAKSLGVENFRISAVFQPNNEAYFSDFFEEARELCRQAAELSDSRFRVSNMFGNRIDDLRQGHPDYKNCGVMQFTSYLGDDMNLYRCCNTAFNERGLIGSIKNQRLKELWFSQAKQDDFNRFDARGCERCQFHAKNKVINSVLQEPVHANFV